jgi:hypothetical protein
LMRAWNQPSDCNDTGLAPALSTFLADYRAIATGFRQFAAQQAGQTDLAYRLIQFICSRRPLLQSRVLQINLS